MEDPVIVWILMGGATLVAIILGSAWKGAAGRLQEALTALEKTRATLAKTEKKLDQRREAAEEKQAQIETLRKKLGKSKKRTASAKQERSSDANRQLALEEDLETARATVARYREELETLRAAGSPPASKKIRAADGDASPRSDDDARPTRSSPAARPVTDEERARLELEAEKAGAKSLELRRQVAEAEAEVKRARGRAETNHRVYLVTKGELEAVNDKLHTLERHLGTRSFRDLLREAGVRIGQKLAATVPMDPEAEIGVTAEQSLAEDARAAVEDQSGASE